MRAWSGRRWLHSSSSTQMSGEAQGWGRGAAGIAGFWMGGAPRGVGRDKGDGRGRANPGRRPPHQGEWGGIGGVGRTRTGAPLTAFTAVYIAMLWRGRDSS